MNSLRISALYRSSNILFYRPFSGVLTKSNESLLDENHWKPTRKCTTSWIQTRNFSAEFYQNYFSADSPPIGLLQALLNNVHDMTGLPWWASIALTTMTLRTLITLPVAVYSLRNMDKVTKLQPELTALSKELKNEVIQAVKQFKWDKTYARYKYNSTMKKLVKEHYIRDNCHPLKSSLIVIFQLPIWVSMSFALRNMSGYVPMLGPSDRIPVTGLTEEGLFWFTNLAIPDSSLILPLMLGGMNLALTEINAYKMQNPTKMQKFITNLFRGLSIMMIPIGATVPSCICLYWCVSSFYGLIQNVAMKIPSVRAKFGLSTGPPVVPVEMKLEDPVLDKPKKE